MRGKLIHRLIVPICHADHPRGCGENLDDENKKNLKKGSPPRMRGKQYLLRGKGEHLGITPADAGKTGGCSHNSRAHEDHPRGCGENPVTACICSRVLGSPPRMRGKLETFNRAKGGLRITPADAGKTELPELDLSAFEDHPRGCGENLEELKEADDRTGSPPRMRGKQGKKVAVVGELEDHPRGCGENN